MGRCTVTTDEELASLYREVQREAGAQQKELLLMEEQNMMKQLKELALVEVVTNIKEDHVTDEQKCQPQDAATTRDRKDEPGTKISSRPKEIRKKNGRPKLNHWGGLGLIGAGIILAAVLGSATAIPSNMQTALTQKASENMRRRHYARTQR